MTSGGSPLLSVRAAEARQLAAPDYAVVDGLIEHTAECRRRRCGRSPAAWISLTADLAALGAAPFDAGARAPPADVVGAFLDHP